jgi:hypothetical protein
MPVHTLTGRHRFHEIYTGSMAAVVLSSALYFAYGLSQMKTNIDGTVNEMFDLSSIGETELAIDLRGRVGPTRARNPLVVRGVDQSRHWDNSVRWTAEDIVFVCARERGSRLLQRFECLRSCRRCVRL